MFIYIHNAPPYIQKWGLKNFGQKEAGKDGRRRKIQWILVSDTDTTTTPV